MTSKTRVSFSNVRDAPEEKTVQKMAGLRGAASLGTASIHNQASWSFTGLLAAQRMTKNLKERRGLKAGRKIPKVEIVGLQAPSFASRPSQKVQVTQIQRLLEGYLPGRLGQLTYDPLRVPSLVKELSEEVKALVKRVLPPRYKVLCVVTLGERGQEDVTVVSRCLWDPHADSYAAHVYQNPSIFCVAAVYAVYCE